MSRRAFAWALIATCVVGLFMRTAWLTADPPTTDAVGIVWHDEGAWVHNARNKALWGVWRTDAWNPVFVAPVFTALEYGAFRALGVGTWQARVVPVTSGLIAVLALVAGLYALAGRRAALLGGALLATNYAFVMWNRAALMESTMTACMVVAWAAYARSESRPAWGLVAGIAAILAWFTKASAAFFLAALVLDVAITLLLPRRPSVPRSPRPSPPSPIPAVPPSPRPSVRRLPGPLAPSPLGPFFVLTGLAIAGLVAVVFFVWPNWSEYQFYNWQMSVTRKPDYTVRALVDRATWLPLVQGLFARMWLVLVAGAAGLMAIALRGERARPAERLLALWVLLGLLELVVHDSGNERRYVMFIPAWTALAVLFVERVGTLTSEAWAGLSRSRRALVGALALGLGYLVAGSLLRLWLREEIDAGHLSRAVRLSAAFSVTLAAAGVWAMSRPTPRRRGGTAPSVAVFWAITILVINVVEFGAWASRRADTNYRASVALGGLLPAGTVVQGKLANGLSLDNAIRPIFVGNHFGNYDDRLRRDDARYILTYDLPRIGYESSDGSGLIQGILDHYPQHRVIATFDVDETPEPDRAALIDKFPSEPAHARD